MERAQLREAREQLGFSLEDVARNLGINKTTVYRWEKKGDVPQPHYLKELCKLYGKAAQDLGFESGGLTLILDRQEPDDDILEAFRQRHVLRRIEMLIWNWSRRDTSYHLLQIAVLDQLKGYAMDEVMSRRDVLRSLALLPIDMSRLSALGAVLTSPVDEILAQCATGIVACWELRKGNDLIFANQTISKYIPTLKAIVHATPDAQRKPPAKLLVQSLLLKAVLSLSVATSTDAVSYAQQAEEYSKQAKSRLLRIVALRTKATALSFANQWKKALEAEEQAKYLIEERDRRDRLADYVHPAEEPIPAIAAAYLYGGLAVSQSYFGCKEDAIYSLQKAHAAFLAQSENDPAPIWIDHSIGNLLRCEGETYMHLEMYKNAFDSFGQIELKYAEDANIPLTCRIGSLNNQIEVEVTRNDRERDMRWCVEQWQKAITGARTLQSQLQLSRAIQTYTLMCAVWPGEKQVKDLRQHLY